MAVEVIFENNHQGMQVLAWDNGVSSLKRLDREVTIITGGARGIGEATVRLLARHDAKVVIANIEDAIGQVLANSLGPVVAFIHCNVTSDEDITTAVDWTLSRHNLVVDGGITSSRNCMGL